MEKIETKEREFLLADGFTYIDKLFYYSQVTGQRVFGLIMVAIVGFLIGMVPFIVIGLPFFIGGILGAALFIFLSETLLKFFRERIAIKFANAKRIQDEIDSLILNDWAIYKAKADEIAAETGYQLFPDEYNDIKNVDDYLSNRTLASMHNGRWRETMVKLGEETIAKLKKGAVIVIGVAAVGTVLTASLILRQHRYARLESML